MPDFRDPPWSNVLELVRDVAVPVLLVVVVAFILVRVAKVFVHGVVKALMDREATEGYWMHNTYVPLSIAWIDQSGAIVDIQDMQPLTDDVHWPVAAYWYALEANQGWFMNNGVGVGQYVNLCLGA